MLASHELPSFYAWRQLQKDVNALSIGQGVDFRPPHDSECNASVTRFSVTGYTMHIVRISSDDGTTYFDRSANYNSALEVLGAMGAL